MRRTWTRRALLFVLVVSSARGVPMNPRARGSSSVQWIKRKDMSARTEDSASLCHRALQMITELCLSGHVEREQCADIFPTESKIPDISVSLLAVLVGFCGLALLVVSLFVFWKLCWPIWRSKALFTQSDAVHQAVLPEAPVPAPAVAPSCPEQHALQAEKQEKKKNEEEQRRQVPEVKVNGLSSVKSLEAAIKISQTSPDIPAEVQHTIRERLSKKPKIQKQSTEPTSFSRSDAAADRQGAEEALPGQHAAGRQQK